MDNQTTNQEQEMKENKQIKEPQTREEVKKERKFNNPFSKENKPVHRMFPIWLRIIVVIVLVILALIIGLIVGYSVLGGAEEPLEVLTFEFWQHVIDIIKGVE